MTTISFVSGFRVEIFSGTSVMYRTSGAQSNTACKHLTKTFHNVYAMWFYVKMLVSKDKGKLSIGRLVGTNKSRNCMEHHDYTIMVHWLSGLKYRQTDEYQSGKMASRLTWPSMHIIFCTFSFCNNLQLHLHTLTWDAENAKGSCLLYQSTPLEYTALSS